MILRLPVPPSTNSLFRNVPGVGRVKTKDYKSWIKHAGMLVNIARPVPFGKARVQLGICIPMKTKGDISNRVKATEDLLVLMRVIDDDSQVWRLTVERHDQPEMLVSLMPFEDRPSLESRRLAAGMVP